MKTQLRRGEVIKFEFCRHSLWKPLYPFCSVCELCKILQKIFVSRLSLFLESSQALLKLEGRYWKAFSTMSQRGIVASFSFWHIYFIEVVLQVEYIQGQAQNYKLQESIEANHKHAKDLKTQHKTKETKYVFDQHVIDIFVDQTEMCCSQYQMKQFFLDAIASPSSYPCQSVSQSLIDSDFLANPAIFSNVSQW